MAAIDQYRELDAIGPAVIHEGIHCRTDGASGVEHVVNEHDRLALGHEGNVRSVDHRCEEVLDVIAVEADVEPADGYLHTLDLLDAFGK